jgi:glycerate 2-kinase
MSERPDLRAVARDIFARTIAEIDVERVVKNYVRLEDDWLIIGDERLDLRSVARLIVIGIGKACLPMGRALESILGDRLTAGLLATNDVVGEMPQRLQVFLGGHPVPNAASLEAAQAAIELLRANDDEQTLVLFLVTGGGSAQFEQPVDASLTLADLQEVNRVLVECGAVIGEMNIVRRHLSAVKGGRLAEIGPRARQISLYISDVNSDDLTSVASGPTLLGAATLADFRRIVEQYQLLDRFPPMVKRLIETNAIAAMPQAKTVEGPECNSQSRRTHHLLLDNRRALEIAQRLSEEHGLTSKVADDLVEGEVEELVREHMRRILAQREQYPGQAVCLLSGGEAICPVRGPGRGGRNQEFVLRAALQVSTLQGIEVVVLSAGTDGIDGRSPATGALADPATVREARKRGLEPQEYLERSDSYTFFAALGDAIVTGPTGNNIRDLRLILAI